MMKKTSKKNINSRKSVMWLWIIITAPFALLMILLLLISLGAFGKLPTFEELENPKSNIATEIYSEDGKMIGSFFTENRSFVDYSELNDSLVWALVSTEDIRYYNHSGIDFISLARVGLKTLAMSDRGQGGGSTITQQLAKNLFPRDTTVYSNPFSRNGKLVISKLKEWITAVKLEHNYTKEEIIAMYLNQVDFGSNAFGIKSAARTFFNKLPSELTINECAMLVGVVNAPSKYSPVRNPERSMQRRNIVLSRMEYAGFITGAQYDSLSKLPIKLDYRPISHNYGTATYFREMLRKVMQAERPKRSDRKYNNSSFTAAENQWNFEQDLRQWDANPLYGWVHKTLKPDGSQYNLYSDGLKIYTTINASMQGYAEQAVRHQLETQIQPAMDRLVARTKKIYFNTSKDAEEQAIRRSMRDSDRYRALRKTGASDKEIEKEFDTPVEMQLFSYSGQIDTLMTPKDSVRYYKKMLRASFMAMDPSNGHVKAYVGGPEMRYFQYDMVSMGRRQVGSTIKPFIYTFAIDHLELNPCTPVLDIKHAIETESGNIYSPKEAGGEKADTYSEELKPLWWGLARSRNNFSLWIMKQAKNPEAVAKFINDLGITSYIYPVPALALGSPEFSLFEMVGAYGVFANKGVHTDPVFVTRIEDRNGNLISTFVPETDVAISEQNAYTVIQLMKRVINNGTGSRLRGTYGFTAEMAGKTGTTNENADAWFIGFVPKLVAGAWVGGDDRGIHLLSQGEGSVLALPIYGEFMKRVFADPRLGISQTDTFAIPPGATVFNCDAASITETMGNIDVIADPGEDEFFD